MMMPKSLQGRIGLSVGVLLALSWIIAATATAFELRREMNEVFDSTLQETAQRLLPLAVVEIIGRDDDGVAQRLGTVDEHQEYFSYVVRDAAGNILLQSHAAELADFPPFDGEGFRQNESHRFYNAGALQNTVTISVSEPLSHRAEVSREIQMGLAIPLLVMLPISLAIIFLAVRFSLSPLRRMHTSLQSRGARDFSPVPIKGLPSEIEPVAATMNEVFEKLSAAFEAERSFAANAAHELRTPLAGSIAQAQRLRMETNDPRAQQRAKDIETTLKRLTRLAERLMELARAEGGQLRLNKTSDLRQIVQLIVSDSTHSEGGGRINISMPDNPVMSNLDPDAFGIIYRNLLDNALRHGDESEPVEITLQSDGYFKVSNAGLVVPPEKLEILTKRFERSNGAGDGTGLGLAIVAAIANRIETKLTLHSPRTGNDTGFEAEIKIPVERRSIG